MPTWLALILALLDLSLLVIVHEFGHFMAAKMVGVWPEEFGVGLPPRVWGKKIRGTLFSVNALPLGGFVKLHGEVSNEAPAKPELAFSNKSKLARAFVALAGIAMNFVFAIVLFTLMFFLTGIGRGVIVVEKVEGTPAAESEIAIDDKVIAVNDRKIIDSDDFPRVIEKLAGEEVNLTVLRGGEELIIPISVNELAKADEGFTGIAFVSEEIYSPPLWQKPFVYSFYGVKETGYWTGKIVEGIALLFQGIFTGNIPGGLAGPVGVTATLSEFIKYGALITIQFTAIISINLALINILPFPPLDGSRVVLLGVEAIIGKKRIRKVEHRILEVGMAILLLLVLVLTITEIPKIIQAGSISAFVDNLFAGN